jgi:hypothetical protein
MKTLAVFDFDDTLFKSDCSVIVTRKDKSQKKMSTHEYAVHIQEPGDKFDFSEFEKYPLNPRPIKNVVKRMLNTIAEIGLENVVILTARSYKEPVEQVLHDFGLPNVFVAAVGSTEPEAKSRFVEMTILEEDYERIVVFEDNVKNIMQIFDSVSKMLGPGSAECYVVNKSGTVIKFSG